MEAWRMTVVFWKVSMIQQIIGCQSKFMITWRKKKEGEKGGQEDKGGCRMDEYGKVDSQVYEDIKTWRNGE